MTIAERKERDREERRMQIIAAAERLFFEAGYDRVSMEQIASEAELSKGTIFFYFKNKEALFTTIVLRGIRLFHQMVSDACSLHEDSPYEQLTRMGMAVIRFSRESPGYLAALRLFKSGRFPIVSDSDKNEEIEEIMKHTQELTENMEHLIKAGMKHGTIRSDLDPRELSIIIRMLIGCVMDINPEIKWLLERHNIPEDQIIHTFCTLVGAMIKGEGR